MKLQSDWLLNLICLANTRNRFYSRIIYLQRLYNLISKKCNFKIKKRCIFNITTFYNPGKFSGACIRGRRRTSWIKNLLELFRMTPDGLFQVVASKLPWWTSTIKRRQHKEKKNVKLSVWQTINFDLFFMTIVYKYILLSRTIIIWRYLFVDIFMIKWKCNLKNQF